MTDLNYKDSFDEDTSRDVDVCIIGTGAGGAVVGYHLAKAGLQVLMLEKGGYYPHDVIDKEKREEKLLKLWKNRGAQVTSLPPIAISQGECVGGSTIINYGMCFEIPEDTLNIWKSKHKVKFSMDELDKEYEEIKQQISVKRITNAGSSHEKLRIGCEELKLSGDWMDKNYTGTGADSVKQNVLISYLEKAPPEKLEIYANCKAEKILTHDKQVTGVKAIHTNKSGKTITINVNSKIVVLSAGAIASSEILLKNKIANDNDQVGKHLSLHPASSVVAIFDHEINGQNDISMAYHCDHFSIVKTHKPGFMIESVFVSPATFQAATPGIGKANKEFLKNYHKSAIAGVLIQDEANGTISLNWSKEAIIDYKLSKSDEEKLMEGIKQTALIFFKAGAKEVITGNIEKTVLKTPYDLWKIEKKGLVVGATYRTASAHPQGGNRMGEDQDKSVVNSYCESHEVGNLYICDASVFPTSLGVNPQLTVMAVASLAVKKIIKEKSSIFG